MKAAARFDVPMGIVPDYATFVRHVWRYADEDGARAVVPPPWVYTVLFEDAEEVGTVFAVIEAVATVQASCAHPMLDPKRIGVAARQSEDGLSRDSYEVRFADLAALHVFLITLAAQSSIDHVARQAGEFLMWTLGFRWV